MADKTGYIGRNPNDSAVTVARQFFTASGVTTTFTFASGYLTGYLDVYVDGVKRRVADEFTATDGSTFDVLQGGVSAGSTVEAVAYKAFNAAAISGDITGNFDVSGNSTLGGSLSVTGGTTLSNLNVTGITTLGAGTTVSFANTAFNLGGTPDISVDLLSAVDINVSGAATIGGILTYEDVTNIDSVGIVTARTGVEVTANGLVVNAGVSTFAADVSIADKIVHTGDTNTAIRFPSADTITAETAGVERVRIDSNGDVGLVGIATATGLVVVAGSGVYAGHTGVVTAVTFDGNVTGNVTGNTAGTHTGALDLNGGVLTLDADADTTITADTDDQIDIAFGGNDRITLSTGLIDLKNDGSQSAIRLYCESSNAHYAALQAPAHSAFSGNITLTLPATTDTLVARTTTDTLTNKTLTSPTITGTGNIAGTFTGNLTGTASNASGATGDFSVADKIVHTGDTDTAIRFPAANTFTVETAGTEALRVDSSQRLLVNTATTRNNYDNGSVTSNLLHVERTAASGNAGISICANAATAADVGAILYMGRTSATSNGGSTIVENNDLIGRISFQGADGSELVEAASIKVDVDGAPGSNDMPGRIEFHTTADGAASATERLRITSAGNVSIQNDSGKFTVGAGDDLQIYHDGSSRIYNDTNDLIIRNTADNYDIYLQTDDGSGGVSTYVLCDGSSGKVRLYHYGSEKLQTKSDGVDITGELQCDSLDVDGNSVLTGDVDFTGDNYNAVWDKSSNRLKFNDNAYIALGTGADANLYSNGSHAYLDLQDGIGNFYIRDNTTTRFTFDDGGDFTATGAVSDSIGDVRKAIQNTQTSAYTLVAADAGKHINISTGGVTVPNGVLSAGDMVTIVNNSGSNQTITQGSSVTMYNTADASTGNRTLAGRGVCTILFASGSICYISGAGLS